MIPRNRDLEMFAIDKIYKGVCLNSLDRGQLLASNVIVEILSLGGLFDKNIDNILLTE